MRVCCVIGNWECGLLWLVFMLACGVRRAGRVVRCSAKRGACKLMGADGELTPHFASLAEGEAFLAEQESAQRGGFTAGAGDGEAKASALTECEDGSGLAVDAAGRWYRDGALVENMVEVDGVPVLVGFVDERCFCEEARHVLVFALHVEALSVRVVVVPFLGFVKPRAFDGAGVLVVAHVNVV